MGIKDKVEMMLDVYQKKMDNANEWNQHAEGLRHEGSILVLETLLIYIKDEDKEREKILHDLESGKIIDPKMGEN